MEQLRGIFSLALVCWLSVSGVYSQSGFLGNLANQAVNLANEFANTANDFATAAFNFVVNGPANLQAEEDFLQAALREINKIRSFYGAPALQLDPELVQGAQAKSDGLSRSRRNAEAATNKYYEIALRTKGASKSVAVGNSVNEIFKKAMEKKSKRPKRDLISTGSDYAAAFVQMVWDGTEKFGVGVTETEKNNYIVVMRFSPPADLDVDEFLGNLPTPNIPFASG